MALEDKATPFDVRGEPVTLVIDEGPCAGIEISATVGVPLGQFLELKRLIEAAFDMTDDELPPVIARASEIFMPHVTGWNLTNDGEPIPVSADALLSLPTIVIGAVLNVWQWAIGRVPPPLVQRPTSAPSTGRSSATASSPKRRRPRTRTSCSPSSATTS